MSETPVILSHNLFKDAVITGDSRDGFPAWRMADGLRWTWWEAMSSATHTISVTVPNLLQNGDFEFNIDGWFKVLSGSAAGSFVRNTTNPLDGDGDGFIDAITVDSGSDAFRVVSIKTYQLEAGRSYRFSFVAKSDGNRDFRFGFIDPGLTTETYSDANIGTGVTEVYKDFTPTASGIYRVFWRPLDAGEFYVDDAHLCEVRDIDTFVLDVGHTLQGYIFKIRKADTVYSNASYIVWYPDTWLLSHHPIYIKHSSTKRGVKWEITITPAGFPGLPVPQIPLLWIGRQWSLPRSISSSFDPDAARNFSHIIRGERGIETRTLRYSQRVLNGVLRNISPDDYVELEKFMEDTEGGALPFVFMWRPETNPLDVLVMRLEKEIRNVPYRGGYLREWPFAAEELAGARTI